MPVSPSRDNADQQWALPEAYARLQTGFRWQVPEHFNMAQVCCTRWAAQDNATKKIAISAYKTGTTSTFYTYSQLQAAANRLSNVLVGLGVGQGDRVAIVLPQCFETAVAYMAVLQMGAVAMPLSQLFGPEALEFRLQDSGAAVVMGDVQTLANLQLVRPHCPGVRHVVGVGLGDGQHALADVSYAQALALANDAFTLVATRAEDPAILIYTSGTTGNPKGALIPHRALIGNLTGFICSQNWFGFDAGGDPVAGLCQLANPDSLPVGSQAVFWSPADWAWTGGLMDALLPTLFFGRSIVAFSGRFSPQTALELMHDCGVTHTFLFPTALKAMMKTCPGSPSQTVQQQFALSLQAIMSAGEAVGDAVFDYCQAQLGVTVNEMFGQTEINYIVGNCAALWPAKPGSMGMGYPGHRLAVIDDAGEQCAPGEVGDVAVHRLDAHGQPDPIFFLGYWKNEAATHAKFTGDWCRTGDLASRDAQGYLWYQGRSDDVFKAAGYRIGPGEIENCLVKHPAVANVAVVPKPDAARGAVVKAYVVLAPDFVAARACYTGTRGQFDAELVEKLQAHVKDKLAPYEYPKEIEFLDALPMTTTGKVQRRVLRLQEEARAQGKHDEAEPHQPHRCQANPAAGGLEMAGAGGARGGGLQTFGGLHASVFLVGVTSLLAFGALRAWETSRRRQYIRESRFPPYLVTKLQAKFPQLSAGDADLVLRGLRQFFIAYLRSDRKFVAMPSKVVDFAWHEFILHTRAYALWCDVAFGKLLHHTPAEVLGRDPKRNDGLRRSWYWACKEESIDPRQPSRLPLLFALDKKFGIPGGYAYVPDCRDIDRQSDSGAYCGTEFGDGGGSCGDADGFGGSESSGGDGGSDAGGCGGGD